MLQLSRASASSALAAPLTAAPRRSLRTPRAAPCTSSLEGLTFAQRCRSAAAAATLAAALTCAPLEGQAHAAAAIQADVPVLDLARVVPASQLEPLQQQLRQLEAETGWRVRMLTRFSGDGPSVEEIRAGWKTDDRTVVVFVDPSCEWCSRLLCCGEQWREGQACVSSPTRCRSSSLPLERAQPPTSCRSSGARRCSSYCPASSLQSCRADMATW